MELVRLSLLLSSTKETTVDRRRDDDGELPAERRSIRGLIISDGNGGPPLRNDPVVSLMTQ